ncbi:hypothetical protein [Microvirga sp. VF16]|uniref:hypothetical protein n=1 Tax=Microvirga sp. VF16 TaxID=2807101 RepID=UPI00193D2F6F|nr:hypothetical protein [Microvirga sp. VF16]QRM28516.1 hypothetical protein JO965_20130 [Microvirga sp. VF16]
MAYDTDDKPVLLIKKLGGVLLLICGLALMTLGYSGDSTGLIVLGLLAAAAGAVLLVLKIVRRNQGHEV